MQLLSRSWLDSLMKRPSPAAAWAPPKLTEPGRSITSPLVRGTDVSASDILISVGVGGDVESGAELQICFGFHVEQVEKPASRCMRSNVCKAQSFAPYLHSLKLLSDMRKAAKLHQCGNNRRSNIPQISKGWECRSVSACTSAEFKLWLRGEGRRERAGESSGKSL